MKDNKRNWRFACYLLFFDTIILFLLVLYLYQLPRIELHKDKLTGIGDALNNGTFNGQYTGRNEIDVSLTEDTLNTIYHEYGHYLYARRFTNAERNEWNKYCINNSELSKVYKKEDICKEEWAINFAEFIEEEGFNYNMLRKWSTCPDAFNFTRSIYLKYIPS